MGQRFLDALLVGSMVLVAAALCALLLIATTALTGGFIYSFIALGALTMLIYVLGRATLWVLGE